MKIETIERIETFAGSYYPNLVDQALSAVDELDVEYAAFNFNGVEVCVNLSTDQDLLKRDLYTALDLDWKTIGPYCVPKYSEDVLSQINAVNEQRELEEKANQEKWRQEASVAQQFLVDLGVDDFSFTIPKRKKYSYGIEKIERSTLPEEGNYQYAVFRWAIEIAKTALALSRRSGRWLGPHINEASHLTDKAMDEGFSGYQFSLAIDVLERYWLYGDVVKRARLMGWPD